MQNVLVSLVTWLAAAMAAWLPPRVGDETRYTSIATDIVTVAYDDGEAPLYPGPRGRALSALMITRFAFDESGGFRDDVDRGRARGDGGKAWCLLQVHVGPGLVLEPGGGFRYAREGWRGEDLIADRTRCIRAALHIARDSLKRCANLSAYLTGRCAAHVPIEARRMRAASLFFSRNEPPIRDDIEIRITSVNLLTD